MPRHYADRKCFLMVNLRKEEFKRGKILTTPQGLKLNSPRRNLGWGSANIINPGGVESSVSSFNPVGVVLWMGSNSAGWRLRLFMLVPFGDNGNLDGSIHVGYFGGQ